MAEKKAEDLIGNKSDAEKGKAKGGPDMSQAIDGPDVLEFEKQSDLKKKIKAWSDPNDLQTERGGLKVKDSDFKTK